MTASEPFGEHDWERLLRVIADGNCTPIVGPGASPSIPFPSQIARQWATEYGYPRSDSDDLAAVAQFLAVTTDAYYPKDLIRQIYDAASAQYIPPGDDDVQGVLASLPIQVYLSTGFDDLLVRALRNHGKDAFVALARWHEDIEETPRTASTFVPTQEQPLVLHFYGHAATPESLVLTEDEHLQVLQNLAAPRDEVLPPAVRRAFASSALLLLGVGPMTLSGRTLLAARRATTKRSLRSSFAVLLPPPDDGSPDASRGQRYLDAYLSQQGIRVYWGDINSFASELRHRWQSYAPDVA